MHHVATAAQIRGGAPSSGMRAARPRFDKDPSPLERIHS
jgi:hypothetical protein